MVVRRKMRLAATSVLAAIGMLPSICGAVSFDCTKAQTFREKAVCSNDQLGGFDDSLNSAYRTATQTWGNKQALVDSQRQWIKNTNRCADEACIAKAYQDRIDELVGSDAEDGDSDNVEDSSAETEPVGGSEPPKGRGVDDILNRVNSVGKQADEADAARSRGAVDSANAYFSNAEEFSVFYSGIKSSDATAFDELRLAAGLDRMLAVNGGTSTSDGRTVFLKCHNMVPYYGKQTVSDLVRLKKSEVSEQPPTFFAEAPESVSAAFAASVGNLKRMMGNAGFYTESCRRSAVLLDSVLKELSRAADSVNEATRASMKVAYAAQLERDQQLKAEQAAATERRAEEQRAEQVRLDAERREAEEAEAATRAAEKQALLDETRRRSDSQDEAVSQVQGQAAYQPSGGTPSGGDTPTQSSSNDAGESKEGFFGSLFSGMAGFINRLVGGIVGFFRKPLLTCLALVPTYLLVRRVRIELEGYVIDPEKDEFSFPGGKISANSVSDYLKGSFIMQAFQRFTIRLSDIQSLSAPSIHKTQEFKDGGSWEWNAHYVEIRGSFGAARFRFLSKGKRDQLFAAIRQANQMGTPVFKSN